MTLTLENPKIRRTSDGGDDACEGIDRISNLPLSILHHIFSLMDTFDVIRASTVSRKWRYIWISMHSLTFSVFHKIWSDKRKTGSFLTVNDEFQDFVNWVLMSQNSAITVKSFRLCGYYNYGDDYTLYRWMNVLAKRNVQELGLMVFSEGPIELPHCLVTCESLVYFKLVFGLHNVLKLSTFAGFIRLNTLSLMNVKLLDGISFRKFISSCPVLEDLYLQACVFSDMKILDISSTSLKNLVIDNGFPEPGGDGLRNCELKVTCPCLVSFYYNGPLAKDFILQDLNSLVNMCFSIDYLTEYVAVADCNRLMHKIFKGISNITVLKLPSALVLLCLQFLCLTLAHPEYLTTSFYNLKSLKLLLLANDWSLKLMVSLLNCLPKLEALTICFAWCKSHECDIEDFAISSSTYNLKMVELYEVKGEKNELEFVSFLLKKGHALEKISISWAIDVKNPGDIVSEVMKFPRMSSNVELKFLQPKSEVDFSEL